MRPSNQRRRQPTTMKKRKQLLELATAAATCCSMFLLPSSSYAFTISFAVPPTLVSPRTKESIVTAPTSPTLQTMTNTKMAPSFQNNVRSRKQRTQYKQNKKKHQRRNDDGYQNDNGTLLKIQPLHRLTTSKLAERRTFVETDEPNLFHDQGAIPNVERTRNLQKRVISSTFLSRRSIDRSLARLLLLNMIIFLLQEFHKLKQLYIAKEMTQKAFLSTISSIDISGFPGIKQENDEVSNDEDVPYRYLTNLKEDNHIVAMNEVLNAQDRMQPIWKAAGQAVLDYALI